MKEKLGNLTARLRRRAEEGREDGKRGSKGFTLIELMVVLLIIGILMAIAIPTYLSERNKANNTGAQSTVRNALTAVDANYASQNAYVSPPRCTSTDYATCMGTEEPSLTWVDSGSTPSTAVKAINSVSIATLHDANSGSGSTSPQAVEVVAWSPTGKCWEALQVQMSGTATQPAGTYYGFGTAGTTGCTASLTSLPTTLPGGGWNNSWATAGQTGP